MRMFKHVLTLVLVCACTIGTGTTITAQESSQAEVQVQILPMSDGGLLGVTVTGVDLGVYEYALEGRYAAGGSISIQAWDLRGTAAGWRVTLSGSDFVDQSGSGDSFSVSQLSLPAGTVEAIPANGHPTNSVPVSYGIVPVSYSANTALVAAPGDGAGIYLNTRSTVLLIPGGTLIGQYQSTLTVTISGTAP